MKKALPVIALMAALALMPDGRIEAEGKAEMCIACHGQKKDNDFIMRSP